MEFKDYVNSKVPIYFILLTFIVYGLYDIPYFLVFSDSGAPYQYKQVRYFKRFS